MSDFRIIITGGRKRESDDDYGTMEDIFERLDYDGLLNTHPDTHPVVVQGGCPDGADRLARMVAAEFGIPVETIPADFDAHPDDAVEVSNQAMVDRGADLCLAFPNADGPSLGTWDMIRRACAAGIETRIYPVG